MKIPKKHAMTLVDFLWNYIDQDFWPVDDTEGGIMAKILGFGLYHSIITTDAQLMKHLDKIGVPRLPAKRLCARLNVEQDEADALIEMIDEYSRFNPDDYEFTNSVRRYLKKELCSATD